MEAASRDITSSEAGIATDMWVEEDEANVDGNTSTEEYNKWYFPRNEKLTYCVEWRPVDHPEDFRLLLYCSLVIGEDSGGRN